jgi:phosphoglycolate phosphatase-like HAD superfamily hydrolase
MLIGLDFDNTIVCYDRLFHRLAAERGLLLEPVAENKTAVRDYLRRIGREPDWTEMQGVGYGPRISDAEPFPGVKEFLARCLAAGHSVQIVSHKTKHPFLGPKYDLHEAAHAFLTAHGFYETAVTGLSPALVNLALTKQAKIDRIAELGCDVFVDDLPEFLAEPSFPTKPRKILFDPAGICPDDASYSRVSSWAGVTAAVFGGSA